MFAIYEKMFVYLYYNNNKDNQIMETTIKTTLKQGAEYDQYSHKSTFHVNGFLVATLDHSSDVFEEHEDMTEADKDYYYKEMVIDRAEFERFKTYEDA